MTIDTSGDQKFLAVPKQSVVNEQGQTFVFVFTGGENFERRPVVTGAEGADFYEVKSGLKEGDRIVTERSLSASDDAARRIKTKRMKLGEFRKMRKEIFTSLVLTGALALLGAACQKTATVNTNSAANQNQMNRNSAGMNANSMNGNSMMNQNSMAMNDHSNMSSMSDMKSSPNAAAQPYDLQFLDTMSHHHQGAVDMAKMAVEKAQHPELKAFAQKIIADQNKEINQMKDWREKWFAGKPMAMNMEMSGMMDSMKMMSGDGMKNMEAMSGNDFDLHFLDMMTPHHAGAVTMSKEALQKAEHTEIKTMANNIIKAQEAEIKQMADWKVKWSK